MQNRKEMAFQKAVQGLNDMVKNSVMIDIIDGPEVVQIAPGSTFGGSTVNVQGLTMKVEKPKQSGNYNDELEMIDTANTSPVVSEDNASVEKTKVCEISEPGENGKSSEIKKELKQDVATEN